VRYGIQPLLFKQCHFQMVNNKWLYCHQPLAAWCCLQTAIWLGIMRRGGTRNNNAGNVILTCTSKNTSFVQIGTIIEHAGDFRASLSVSKFQYFFLNNQVRFMKRATGDHNIGFSLFTVDG
jgi:hypothetical protein